MCDRSSDSRWTVVVIGTVVLLVGSLVPSPLERRPEWELVGPDKLLHLLGHGGYAVTLAAALGVGRCTDEQAAVLAVCISTTHSLVTGRLQTRVPGRAFEPADVVAGTIGAILAVGGWYVANDTSVGSASEQTPADERQESGMCALFPSTVMGWNK